MSQLPRIRVLAMGGTISSTAASPGGEASPTLRAAQIVESVPHLDRIAAIEAGDIATVASFAVTPTRMLELAREVTRAFDEGVDGVVVTHGTDTIEETAYALALCVPRGKPVVVTGAMRNPSLPGAEGAGNLLDAFLVAVHPDAGALGTVVVLNDEVHAARFATKAHSTRLSTFVSAGAGPIGEAIEERAYLWFTPLWEDYLGLPESLDHVDVQLLKLAAGVDATLLEAAVARQPDAIVIDGFGGGHVHEALLPALDRAIAAGIPVVIASRALAGRTLERTYRIEGAETDLIDRGAIMAGHLSGQKARLRLLVGIALGKQARSLFPVP